MNTMNTNHLYLLLQFAKEVVAYLDAEELAIVGTGSAAATMDGLRELVSRINDAPPREFQPLTADEVEFEFEAEPEYADLEDWLISGDPEYDEADRQYIAEVRERLERDDMAAWFCAKVTAKWNGFVGVNYLGCNSYESFDQFLSDEYYESMKSEALAALNAKLKDQHAKLNARVK